MDTSIRQSTQLALTIAVFMVVVVGFLGWYGNNQSHLDKSFKNAQVEQIHIHDKIINKDFPTIVAKNAMINKGDRFHIFDYVQAYDQNVNISESLVIYGEVNSLVAGIYPVRCVVVNAKGFKSVKYIQVVVNEGGKA